jgi:hypothetical protein
MKCEKIDTYNKARSPWQFQIDVSFAAYNKNYQNALAFYKMIFSVDEHSGLFGL